MTNQLCNGKLLHQRQDIRVYENKLFRWLCFDDEKAIQSCMLKAEPARLNLAYQPYMMMWQLFFNEKPSTACLLGLGGGDVVRYFRDQFPMMKILAVEKDIEMAKIANEYFHIQPDQKYLTIEMVDAENFAPKYKHDVVLIDVVANNTLPAFIYQEEFWNRCYQYLSKHGVLSLNVIPESEIIFKDLLTLLRKMFGRLPLCMEVPDHKNVVLLIVASGNDLPSLSELRLRCGVLQESSELPYEKCFEVLVRDNGWLKGGGG